MDAYICMAESLCCPPETYHNIVNQYQYKIVVFQSLSRIQCFATPWSAARQASLSFPNSQSLLKFMSIKLAMPANHSSSVVLFSSCLQSFPASGSFFKESALYIRWPKYWSFSFSTSPSNEYSELISLGLTDLISLLSKGSSRVFSSTTIWKHQFSAFFMVQLSHPYMTTGRSISLTRWTFVGKVMSLLWSSDALW